ncbi:hypothetical protein [Raoultella ornithinolytica]|uniref:Uncharacterized protein n=1 Tax=Raoultella ornithinolytica TaxID=54291 RepID=A0A9Q9MY07_RAOOR|nr:hypothetical protein [Raoultella ornithinolytica]UXE37721.1 hypothetical protein N2J37_25005 [Raoultella ornithinolytica]
MKTYPFYAEKSNGWRGKGEQYHLGEQVPGRRGKLLARATVRRWSVAPVSVAPAGGYGTALVSNSGKRRASGRFPGGGVTPLPGLRYGAGQ